jgi:hypothetical protein
MAIRPLESSRTVAEADDTDTEVRVDTVLAGGAGAGLGNGRLFDGEAADTTPEQSANSSSAEYRFTDSCRPPMDAVSCATLETDLPLVNRFDGRHGVLRLGGARPGIRPFPPMSGTS